MEGTNVGGKRLRIDGRNYDELRSVKLTVDVNKYAEGSVFIEMGDTKIICTATIEERVPPFLKGQGKGWVTAEYSMLPRATQSRNVREAVRGKLGGRTMEIQRLIGRALRAVIDCHALGERTVTLDCDVIQADGGTRTTAITGSFVALALALAKSADKFSVFPLRDFLASVSVGTVANGSLLDLNYVEDSTAIVDMNVVMTGSGNFVEIQGTGEEAPFSRKQMNEMIDLAESGIRKLIQIQREVLGEHARFIGAQAP